MNGRELLNRQRKSREKLGQAAARYAGLRAADGPYQDTIRCLDRAGRPVTILLRLDIVSEETTDGRA